MKITMYELYGKIYGENPPKHIRVYGEDWYWNDCDGYVTKESLKTTPDAQIYLMDRYRTFMNLDKEVEIPVETSESCLDGRLLNQNITIEPKGIPEKLGECAYVDGEIAYSWSKSEAILKTKINELIDYLGFLKSKGE